MHPRKIRRHQSGTANLSLTQSGVAFGETFHDQMTKTMNMTRTNRSQLPTLPNKYNVPGTTDTRGLTLQTSQRGKVSVTNPKHHLSQSVKERRESFKNQSQDMQLTWTKNLPSSKPHKINQIEGFLRRKYEDRSKMLSVFQGWDGQSKGYVDYQSVKSVLGMMGVDLTEQESKQLINRYTNGNSKLDLDNFADAIYNSSTSEALNSRNGLVGKINLDQRFQNSFVKQQTRTQKIRMQNVNSLGSYQLQKAAIQGERLKNRLQKYLATPIEAEQLLFESNGESLVPFNTVKDRLVEFLTEKEGQIRQKQLQGFLSLFQYNVKSEVGKETLCKGIFQKSYLHSRQFVSQKSPPVSLNFRKAPTSLETPSHSVDIPGCLRKIDEVIFRGSSSYKDTFKTFDRDHDRYISEADFVKLMRKKNLLSAEESKEVFDHIGGNKGKYEKCIKYQNFMHEIRAGMGTQTADQYPSFLRPKKVIQFRSQQKFTKSQHFDPRSTLDEDQRKTRFNGTPAYAYSTLGSDGTKFWGASGDLNSKVAFQKQQQHQHSVTKQQKLDVIASNREKDSARRDRISQLQDTRNSARLHQLWVLRDSYERNNHPGQH